MRIHCITFAVTFISAVFADLPDGFNFHCVEQPKIKNNDTIPVPANFTVGARRGFYIWWLMISLHNLLPKHPEIKLGKCWKKFWFSWKFWRRLAKISSETCKSFRGFYNISILQLIVNANFSIDCGLIWFSVNILKWMHFGSKIVSKRRLEKESLKNVWKNQNFCRESCLCLWKFDFIEILFRRVSLRMHRYMDQNVKWQLRRCRINRKNCLCPQSSPRIWTERCPNGFLITLRPTAALYRQMVCNEYLSVKMSPWILLREVEVWARKWSATGWKILQKFQIFTEKIWYFLSKMPKFAHFC